MHMGTFTFSTRTQLLLPLSSPPNAKTDPHVEVTANEPESLPTACGQSLELYYVHLQKTDSSGEFLSVYY